MIKLCESLKIATNSVQSNQGPQKNGGNKSNNNYFDTGNDDSFLDCISSFTPDDQATFMNS